MDECHVVDMSGQFREEVGGPSARLAMLFKCERTLHYRSDRTGKKTGRLVEALDGLSVPLGELWLVVPRVDLAGPPVHEKPDDRFGGGWEMRLASPERIVASGRTLRCLLFLQQALQCQEAKATSRLAEQLSSSEAFCCDSLSRVSHKISFPVVGVKAYRI